MAWLNLVLVGKDPQNKLSDRNYQRPWIYLYDGMYHLRGESFVYENIWGREGKEGELNALGYFAVDETIFKISAHLGLATNLHSVKGNYYYPHFRNDDREADVLCG